MNRISVDALFFDFDGTLGDTRQGIRNAWKQTIAENGLECPDFDKLFRVGPPADSTAALLFSGAFTGTTAGDSSTLQEKL